MSEQYACHKTKHDMWEMCETCETQPSSSSKIKTKTINGSKPCLEIRSNEDLLYHPDYHLTRPWWQKQRKILTIMIVKDWFKRHPWGEEFQTNILLSRTMVVTYHPTCHLWSDHYFPCSPGNSQGLHLIPWRSYVSIRCDASIETCHLGREGITGPVLTPFRSHEWLSWKGNNPILRGLTNY